jgi:hypothetical protein
MHRSRIMEKIDVIIKGTKPLLMHSTAGMLVPKSKKVKSSEHDPEEEAKLCLYLNDDKKICVPAMAILSAMRKAATNLKKGGAGKKTLKDFVYSGLQIDTDMIVLTPQEYVVDIQMVVVNRARIPRARPLFKNWSISFGITIVDEQTWDNGTVRQVLEEAGKYQGLLDFRPLYGTFEVVSMKVGDKEVK